MTDYRQLPEYNRYFAEKGWLVEPIGATLALVKKIPLLGAVMKIKRCPPDISLDEVERVAQKHHVCVVKIEADVRTGEENYARLEEDFYRHGYVNSHFTFCPTKTAYVDLNQSEAELLASFDRDIRRHLKKNGTNGIKVERQTITADFYSLLETAGKGRHFVVQKRQDWQSQWGALQKWALVVLAYKSGVLLGGNFSLAIPPDAYGIFLPLTAAGRKTGVAYTLLWEGFRWAREKGCRSFDLDGLYDRRYGQPKEWLGLTAFKRKFRGQEKEFMQAKVKVRRWYLKPLAWTGFL